MNVCFEVFVSLKAMCELVIVEKVEVRSSCFVGLEFYRFLLKNPFFKAVWSRSGWEITARNENKDKVKFWDSVVCRDLLVGCVVSVFEMLDSVEARLKQESAHLFPNTVKYLKADSSVST